MDNDLVNFAKLVASELRAECIKGKQLYITGNMQRSITVASVNDDFVDVVIATDYASYTNTRGKQTGWVQRVIDRASRCFASNNNVDNDALNGMVANVYYGG